MLVIRNEQIRAIENELRFDLAVGHARKFFPDQCEELGEAALEHVISRAMVRARSYGLTSARDLLQFLSLVLLLGEHFDQLPWAQEILNDRFGDQGALRSTRLHNLALRYLNQIS